MAFLPSMSIFVALASVAMVRFRSVLPFIMDSLVVRYPLNDVMGLIPIPVGSPEFTSGLGFIWVSQYHTVLDRERSQGLLSPYSTAASKSSGTPFFDVRG